MLSLHSQCIWVSISITILECNFVLVAKETPNSTNGLSLVAKGNPHSTNELSFIRDAFIFLCNATMFIMNGVSFIRDAFIFLYKEKTFLMNGKPNSRNGNPISTNGKPNSRNGNSNSTNGNPLPSNGNLNSMKDIPTFQFEHSVEVWEYSIQSLLK